MRSVVLLATIAFSATGGYAHAVSADEEALIGQGIEKRRTRDDAAALDLFERAYALGHSPRAAAQMGLAEVALGRWVDAKAHLDEALSNSSDTWIAKHRPALKESLSRAQQHVGLLEVLGGPFGAQITIEGSSVGTLPLKHPISVRSGDCRFFVKAPGYEPISRNVDVTPGQLTRETVNLARVGSADGDMAVDAATAPTRARRSEPASSSPASPSPLSSDDVGAADQPRTPTGTPAPAQESPTPASSGGSSLRTLAAVLGSAGLAGVAVGGFFGWRTYAAAKDDANSATFNPDAERTGHRYQTLQYVGYGVGVALLAAGITVFVVGGDHDGESTGPTVAVSPLPSGAAFALQGRF